ncbi:MAG: hypothetical protein MUD08_11210 [Cytophagales bacterium]|jgi:hypothetical protein|nr:hypothetical protein [Cytophagales bacterium]
MKKQIAFVILCLSFSVSVFAQEKPAPNQTQTVTVTFKNNSLLPRKYTFVTYAPGSDGNSTYGKMMAPGGTTEFKVAAGTTFYLADSEQKDIVMSGSKLSGKPFYTAVAKDNGKTINLRKD